MPLGTARIVTLMVDMPALSSACLPAADALKAAGLTPAQHDIYRAALIGARLARWASRDSLDYRNDGRDPPLHLPKYIAPTSVTAKNLAFMEAHPALLQALAATDMWRTP